MTMQTGNVAMVFTSQPRRRLDSCRDLLEEALLELRELPANVDRGPLSTMLERALAMLVRFADSSFDADDFDAIDAARAAVMGAIALAKLTPASNAARRFARLLGTARQSLETLRKEAIDEMVSRPLRDSEKSERNMEGLRFRASRGIPNLHSFEREPLAPFARTAPRDEVPPSPPVPGQTITSEEDDDTPEPRERGTQHAPAAALLVDQLRRLARDCFEEIGMLGNLREPTEDVPWCVGLSRFDDRLLADLDAVISLGEPVFFDGKPSLRLDVLSELLAYVQEVFVPDPGRAFACAFVLGCIEGEDTIRAAILCLRQSNRYVHEAYRNAFRLVSNSAIESAMEKLAMDADSDLVKVALDVLHARRNVRVPIAATLLLHPKWEVRLRSAACLGVVRERDIAMAILSTAFLNETDSRVMATITESMVRLGFKHGLLLSRQHMPAGDSAPDGTDVNARTEWARIVAVAGGPEDTQILTTMLDGLPHDAEIELIGFHGHVASVEPLVAALERACSTYQSIPVRSELAHALRRITGQDVEPTGEGVEAFRRYWQDSGGNLMRMTAEKAVARSGPKLRFGEPYTPQASLRELRADGLSQRTRALLAFEVAVASRGAIQIDVFAWVARQLRQLDEAFEMFERGVIGWNPGKWLEFGLV